MVEPTTLKILNAIPNDKQESFYMKNLDNATYIKVPSNIYKTLIKISGLGNNIGYVAMNVLATAINKRRLEDVTNHLKHWESNSLKPSIYPICNANKSFDKLITTFFENICCKEIKDQELKNLISFFAKCPHGFDVSELIKCSSELKPVTT